MIRPLNVEARESVERRTQDDRGFEVTGYCPVSEFKKRSNS